MSRWVFLFCSRTFRVRLQKSDPSFYYCIRGAPRKKNQVPRGARHLIASDIDCKSYVLPAVWAEHTIITSVAASCG